MPDERALIAHPDGGIDMSQGTGRDLPTTGVAALAAMPDEDFERRLTALKAARERIKRVQDAVLTRDVDYGLVPGTEKPTLFKAGAETLNSVYGLVADIDTTFIDGDGVVEPTLRYDSTCRMRLGDFDGPIVAIGYGTANSWESKYRWRTKRLDLACPGCGNIGSLFKTRETSKKLHGRWWDPQDKGGCGESFDPDDPRILSQPRGIERVENENPHELANTLLKMAEKRAYVDGTLRATATSWLFTQDVAEEPEKPEQHEERQLDRAHASFSGIVRVGDKAGSDLHLRVGPADDAQPETGFRLEMTHGTAHVIAEGEVAAGLFSDGDDPEPLLRDGDRVTVTGMSETVYAQGHRPYQQITAAVIVAADEGEGTAVDEGVA